MKRLGGSRRVDRDALAEDRQLVRGMLAGQQDAFDQFADNVLPKVYRFAGSRLRGRPELVAEIVQNAIVKAIAKLDTWRGESTLATWLCSCCRYEIALYYRGESRSPEMVELTENTTDVIRVQSRSMPNPEQLTLAEEAREAVHRALDALPTRYGNVLEWKYLEQASVKEIALRLETTDKAAESLLTRARNAFRDAYEGTGFDDSSKTLAFSRFHNQPVSTP